MQCYPGDCRRGLVGLVNLHVVIDGQIGIANRGTCWRGLMAGADAELFTRAVNRISVSIAPGARHGQIARRCELGERSATAIQGDESALRGSDLQQIGADSGEGDGLRGRRTLVGRRHFLKIKMKSAICHGGSDENDGQGFHTMILGLCEFPSKRRLLGRCITKQQCCAFAGTSPSEVLAMLNRRVLLRGIPRRHVTVQYPVFDEKTREMRIASGGMAGPVHISAGGCRELELSGIPPGLFCFAEYSSVTIPLEAGDSVLLFTDGMLLMAVGNNDDMAATVFHYAG